MTPTKEQIEKMANNCPILCCDWLCDDDEKNKRIQQIVNKAWHDGVLTGYNQAMKDKARADVEDLVELINARIRVKYSKEFTPERQFPESHFAFKTGKLELEWLKRTLLERLK